MKNVPTHCEPEITFHRNQSIFSCERLQEKRSSDSLGSSMTFLLRASAKVRVTVDSKEEASFAIDQSQDRRVKILVIAGGRRLTGDRSCN